MITVDYCQFIQLCDWKKKMENQGPRFNVPRFTNFSGKKSEVQGLSIQEKKIGSWFKVQISRNIIEGLRFKVWPPKK